MDQWLKGQKKPVSSWGQSVKKAIVDRSEKQTLAELDREERRKNKKSKGERAPCPRWRLRIVDGMLSLFSVHQRIG